MMYCIVGLRTSLLLLILPCICPIFFLSILWTMKFSSMISLKLCKLEYSYLVCRLIMMYCTVGLRPGLLLLILLCIYLFFFLYIFRQRYLHNYRVSQKNVDLFWNWYNSFIHQGIFPKFCMAVAKWYSSAPGEESIYSYASKGSDVTMTSNPTSYIICFSGALFKT